MLLNIQRHHRKACLMVFIICLGTCPLLTVYRKMFALKFTEPKSTAERNAIINEIGIMQLGNCTSVV